MTAAAHDAEMLGHADQWTQWHAALGSARLHHGWILAGRKGLGKAAFARRAAAELVGMGGAPVPDNNAHPDIIVLDHLPANDAEEAKRAEGKPWQAKRNITIDQIRRMQSRLTTRPTLGARRCVIIDPADDMEKGAVNALLKSLEEPPAGTYFLLIAHQPGRLLPTIRSRCRMLRFSPLDDTLIDRILCIQAPEADAVTRAAAVAAAEGSPGAALDFVTQDLGRLHAVMVRILDQGDRGFELRGELAGLIGARPDRARQQAVGELARAVLAANLDQGDRGRTQRLIAAHGEMVRLCGQLATYNFDPGLAAMEIGGLLASVAVTREAAR